MNSRLNRVLHQFLLSDSVLLDHDALVEALVDLERFGQDAINVLCEASSSEASLGKVEPHKPLVIMIFNGPVYGVTGNVEGNVTNSQPKSDSSGTKADNPLAQDIGE